MNIRELQAQHPGAYETLPEAYQNDDCLIFEEREGIIFAYPKVSERQWLGDWTAAYAHGSWEVG